MSSINDPEYYDKEYIDRFVSRVDSIIQRYLKDKLCITKFSLEFPILDPNMALVLDT